MKSLIDSPNFGILVFRVFIGLTMAFAHGLGKLPPPQMLIDGVQSMGFPLPVVFAWAAALSEFVGALLIAAGLFTRYAAGFLAFTMGVAAFVVHAQDTFDKKEMALLYLAACVLIMFVGAGRFSLDRIIRKK